MSGLRDYEEWHRAYDEPDSGLSWRLRTVQTYLRHDLDNRRGPLRVLSLCAGDGRDLLGVLSARPDAGRVSATLVEIHPDIAQRARDAATAAGLAHIEVRTADAGHTDTYVGATPADLVLMVGIFGNIGDADVALTIATAPQLCRPGATLVWSRGRDVDDRNDAIRAWFSEAGFTELDYAWRDGASRPALGAMRYDGEAHALVPGRRLFTFQR